MTPLSPERTCFVKTLMCVLRYVRGIISFGWRAMDHLILALGTDSLQPARTADGQSLRFPFWDFVSPANNFSKFFLTASILY